jgi:signal transduction histidine kinase
MVQALEENRRIAHALRPSDLDELGLVQACRNLCRELEVRSNLGVSCQITEPTERLAPAVELNLFRIIQEGLNNVEQHSEATSVWVELGIRDGPLELSIRDNGHGFDPQSAGAAQGKRRGMGLTNVRERAAAIGAGCEISSAPNHGTLIRLRLPV